MKNPQKVPTMPTGLKELDELIWGLHPGNLTVIAAQTKSGKTSLASQIFWNVIKAGKFGAYFSLEMRSEEIIKRIACQEMRINGFNAFHRRCPTAEDAENVHRFMMMCFPFAHIIIDDRGYNADELIESVDDLIAAYPDKPISFIVVDHVQRCQVIPGQSRNEAVSNYVSTLKYIAQTRKIAVLACSQLHRVEGYTKWSSEIEEACDTLLKCSWPQDMSDWERYEINVELSRHGPSGKIDVRFLSNFTRFEDRA